MRTKLSILLTGAALMLVVFGCSADKLTEPNSQQVRLRPVSVLQEPGIGDLVWMDANMNGIQDDPAEEPGLADVAVQLLSCNDSTVIATDTTDSNGLYGFEDLTPGDYFLHFALPQGYAFSPMNVGVNDTIDSDADTLTGYTTCITVDTGEVDLNWDAGMYPLAPPSASIGDFVWNDVNMNGIQDSGEAGIAGVEVWIASCPATDSTMFNQTTMTDSMGHYLFTDLLPGDYVLHFGLPLGYAFSPMDQGDNDTLDSDVDPATGYTQCFTVEGGTDQMSWDAGMYVSTSGCTHSKGYWKNHAGFGPQPDMVTALLPIWLGDSGGAKSFEVNTARIAVDILQQQTYNHPSNGITKLYAQLLTTKLNMANGAGGIDIAGIIPDIDAFLADHDWTDWGNLSPSQMKMVLRWMGKLASYNEGDIGPGYCGDDENHDGDDHDGDMGDSASINVVPSGDLSRY
jgi:hypothetical protein